MLKFIPITCGLFIAAHAHGSGPVQAGKARVEWVTPSTTYQPGQAITTGFKMVLDEGWHTYWINPGEAGMPLGVDFSLPDGWKADEPMHPVPIRFKTGDLADFGYADTVIFPIILHPPEDSPGGDVKIQATFSWLTCDDSACIPGDATLTLSLPSGDPDPTPAAGEIAAALKTIPAPAVEPWRLNVTASQDKLDLDLTVPEGVDPRKSEVFPLTVNAVHPAAVYRWSAVGNHWTATVPKSPYAPDTLRHLELVVHAPALENPVSVTWSID